MGLDIHAYANVKLVQEKTDEIECLWEWAEQIEGELHDTQGTEFCESLIVLYTNPSFPKQKEGIVDGCYSYSDSMSVCSRSYSG